jgi:phage tail-like protein
MAGGPENNPYQHYNFLVEIDGVPRAGFTEVSGMTTDTDPIPYREGADKVLHARILTGLRKYTPIVCKRGWTQDKFLWQWRLDIIRGTVRRRDADIVLLDEQRTEVLRWRVSEAWVSKWETSPLNAKTNEVAIESIELQHEGLELVTAS